MVASSTAATAQQKLARANVPFAFQVGKTALPAGSYAVGTDAGVQISVRDRNSGHGILAIGQREMETNPTQARLVFHHYGNKYFLSEIWYGGEQGMKLPATKQEQEYRASASTPSSEQTILLAMN